MNASGSFDPDGTITHYQWIQVAGNTVVLSDPESTQPTFTALNVGSPEKSLVFQLNVTDNDELQSIDTVVVIANDSFVLPHSHDFGNAVVGSSSAPLEIVISNIESGPIEISDITLTDTQNFYLDLDGGPDPIGTIPNTILPGSSATVIVVFSPSAPGMFNVQLNLSSDDPFTPNATVSLSGWARNDSAQENFIVTIGQDKEFGALIENLNVQHIQALSDVDGSYTIPCWLGYYHYYRVTKVGYVSTYTFPRERSPVQPAK